MMMMTVMKTSVLTMLAALLNYEKFHINGKINFIYFSLCLTILVMELIVDGTFWLYYTDWKNVHNTG